MVIQFINRLFSAVFALLILHTMSLFTWRVKKHASHWRSDTSVVDGVLREHIAPRAQEAHRCFSEPWLCIPWNALNAHWTPSLLWLCLQGNIFPWVKENKNRRRMKTMDQNKPRIWWEVSIVSPLSMVVLIDQYPILFCRFNGLILGNMTHSSVQKNGILFTLSPWYLIFCWFWHHLFRHDRSEN